MVGRVMMPTAGECEEAYVLISYWWVMGVERGVSWKSICLK